ncbi:G2-specific serine/threonine protein kinase [Linnemannia gamsii]|uniref:non-specific serine/threonine protein kinase n=1 Tax=Linnemannia gamsii TaxID=64522 RepID=A0A9P6UQZ6_9FUNG|nr:G2-specific serine/threonine protein kinase [Linnemannia gamsii]
MLHDVLEMDGYESLESIGSGSFGLIRKVRRKADGKILARKEIDYRKMTTKEKEQLVAEVNILKDLKHPNIVQFLERVIDREHCFIYILMEYCEGGDLAAVIKRHKESSTPIPEEFIWNIMVQLIMALHECHHGTSVNEETHQVTPRPILHRDLKPDNVFLDGKHNVKLGDFGLSRSLTNPQKAFAQTYVGTPFYMSPELISEFTYDAKSDIWSLGCVIYELCALQPPFLADTQAQLSARIKEGRVQSLPGNYTQELNQIVKWMLRVDSRKRPTTKELLSDSQIKKVQKGLELTRRTDELRAKAQLHAEREANIAEKEAQLTRVDREMRAKDQTQRERETAQNAREETLRSTEETLRNAEEVLRSKEAHLISWEQKLIKDQQLLDERYRALQEQEKMAGSRKSLTNGSSSTEAMMVDSKSIYDLHSATVASTSSTAMDINGTNGVLNKHTRSTGQTSKPTLFPTTHRTALPTSNSYPSAMFSASVNAAPKGTLESMATIGDVGGTIRAAPRRKTGLNVGRHSLQTTNASRTRVSGGLGGTGTASHTTNTDAQDKGGLFSGGQALSNPVVTQPRPSSVFASLSSIDNTSNSSKQYQAQSYTFHGITGKESRLSGRPSLAGNTGSDPQRLRAKVKSASSLVTTLSSTTLSGTGGTATSAAPPTTASIAANNHTNNPFPVSDAVKSAATSLPTTTPASSAADQSNITFGNNSNATFYFTPSATLSSIRPSDQNLESSDVQMGESAAAEPPASSSSSTTRLSSGGSSATNSHLRNGNSQTNGVSPITSTTASGPVVASSAVASSSSMVTSAPQTFTSRRTNTSGITASMGHIRFQQHQHQQNVIGSGVSQVATNSTATIATTTTTGSAPSQATASTSAAGTATGAHDTKSTTTPIKFHIGSGGGGGGGGGGAHALGSDRFSRDRTPPPNNHNRHHHHLHHHHHHQSHQQPQQQQQHQPGGHYRDDDEDLRMEWDGDIPSPFIKKTYNRPLNGISGSNGSSTARNIQL